MNLALMLHCKCPLKITNPKHGVPSLILFFMALLCFTIAFISQRNLLLQPLNAESSALLFLLTSQMQAFQIVPSLIFICLFPFLFDHYPLPSPQKSTSCVTSESVFISSNYYAESQIQTFHTCLTSPFRGLHIISNLTNPIFFHSK